MTTAFIFNALPLPQVPGDIGDNETYLTEAQAVFNLGSSACSQLGVLTLLCFAHCDDYMRGKDWCSAASRRREPARVISPE